MKKALKFFVFAVFVVGILTSAEAQEVFQDAAPETIRVDSIVVAAPAVREIVPAQILADQQLRRLETHSVADAVRLFSGVQIKDYGGVGGLKTVNVRSLGSNHVGVFYDGIAVGNAQNGVVDLGRFSLDNVESVALYNGQRSAIFQSAKDFSSAAALYICTRRPVENRFRARVAGGSFDLIDGSVLAERKFGDKLSISANVQVINTSGRYKYHYSRPGGGWDTTAVRSNGDVRVVRAEAGLWGRTWNIKTYFYDSDRGLPGAVIKEDAAIALRNNERQRDRNFFAQGAVGQRISRLYSYRVQAKYANDYTNYVMPPSTTLRPVDAHYHQQEAYVSAVNFFAINHWLSANLSLDGQYNTLRAEAGELFERNFPHPRRLTALGAAAISLNLRNLSAQTSLLYTYAHDTSAVDRPMSKDRNVLSPTVVLAYRPTESIDLEIRAFYKDIFRLPTFNDLYYTDAANRVLRPEYTTQHNIGATWRKFLPNSTFASLEVSFDAYYNRVRDKIVATPTSNQLVWTMTNIGRAEILGTDISITQQLILGSQARKTTVDTRLSYTFQDTSGGDPVPYAPRHSGSVVVSLTWGRTSGKAGVVTGSNARARAENQWSLDYSFIYTGERYRLGSQTSANLLKPWYTHDLAISREFALRRASTKRPVDLRFSLEVNNIFNQRYEVVRWYPMPGTNVKLIISISL